MSDKFIDKILDDFTAKDDAALWDGFEEVGACPQCTFDDAEYAQDQVPPIGTNHVAAQILAQALGVDPPTFDPRGRPTGGARGFAAFGIGRGGQADPTGLVQSLVDAQWTGPDGRRINLEVDRPGRSRESPRGIDTHKRDHIRAMAAAVGRGHSPSAARSVFVTTDAQGRVREVRHVHYETRTDQRGRQRVVGIPDAHVVLDQPLSPTQAWASNILQDPAAARQQGQTVSARRRRPFSLPLLTPTGVSRRRTATMRGAMVRPARRTGRVRGRSTTRRFDAYDDFLAPSDPY